MDMQHSMRDIAQAPAAPRMGGFQSMSVMRRHCDDRSTSGLTEEYLRMNELFMVWLYLGWRDWIKTMFLHC
eukprot:164846-Pelagomonas_calceolata.AAC.4